jgi:hypothetical protein
MSYSKQELRDIAAKKEKSLSPEQKKILDETMSRHDKAFKKLAVM